MSVLLILLLAQDELTKKEVNQRSSGVYVLCIYTHAR